MTLSYLCLYVCLAYGIQAIDYKEKYFEQVIDHFNFLSIGNQTFLQRYLYNDSWWSAGVGPIFFYAGNEGDIDSLWEGNGFVQDIAPEFKALVLFAEHRYYGKSLPFGNDSFSEGNIGYLSIEQALADYAIFVTKIKECFHAEKSPVVVFGGSYGGMLAAYMRFKYPNVVVGAIAASAPIMQTAGLTNGNIFFQAITKVVHNTSPKCESQVRVGFRVMDQLFDMGEAGLEEISYNFHLCSSLKSQADYEHLQRLVRNAFVYEAMLNYPYKTDGFPANPIKAMCKLITTSDTPIQGLYAATNMYYNFTGDKECLDIYKEYITCADPTGCGLGDNSKSWDYQACTEINLEGSTNGKTDMFPILPFNSSMRDEYCEQRWGVTPRRDWLKITFWGYDIASASNIVFSNGDLDPWAPGGVLQNVSDTLIAVIVKGGAHHLDLRGKNVLDPPSVKEARATEVENIRMWLGQP